MAKSPDVIETRSEAKKVTESMSTPATPMAITIESFVSLMQKINDIADARKAIVRARDLFNSGDTDKAKKLTLGIFERLKQIGKAPEGLDISQVQGFLIAGKFDELAKAMKENKDKGDASKLKGPEALVDRVGKVVKDKPLDKKQQAVNKRKNSQLLKDISDEVVSRKDAVDKEEVQLHKELDDLVKLVGKKSTTDERERLDEIRDEIAVGGLGEVNIRGQIKKLKDSIRKGIEVKINDWDDDKSIGERDTAKKIKAGSSKDARKGLAESLKRSKKGEQVFVGRAQKLFESIDGVEGRLNQGLGLTEAVRDLHPDQIREIRALLSSLSELDVDERSPYYDEQYLEFIDNLELKSDELVALKKMLNGVDIEYRRAQLESPSPKQPAVGERGPRGRMDTDDDPLNEEGYVKSGMNLNIIGDEDRREEYERGLKNFEDMFIQTSDGGWIERSFEEQIERKRAEIRRYAYAQRENRESFLNINMKDLFDYIEKSDKENGTNFHSLIDIDDYLKSGVAKLKDEYMSPKSGSEAARLKSRFEMWWYQEASFNQRMLAYEGLFERRNQSPRMQRLNSLMEIIGVGTDKKALANWMAMSYGTIDQQNNSYVNEEFMQKLASIWTNQGVDWRLEDSLKEMREEISFWQNDKRNVVSMSHDVDKPKKEREKATISVMDTVTFMQKDITDKELRKKLGIPDWWHGNYGTMIYKYSQADKRAETRRIIWDHFLEKDLGVDMASLNGHDVDIYNKYSLMFDLGFQYSVVHKQLHMMIGNASFQRGELELPAAAAEMHIKLDPLAYPKLFAPRFQFLNVQLKEVWALFDPGVRDYVTMALQDYASHFTELSVDKPGAMRQFTNEGAPTIGNVFLGGRVDADALKIEKELQGIFSESLLHWGIEPGKGGKGEMNTYMELGVYGDQKSAFRRSAGEVAKKLLANTPSVEALKAINWDKYLDIVKSPIVRRKFAQARDPEAKWRVFAETFGESSFNHTTPAAKRSGDHPVKYGVDKFIKYRDAFLAWAEDPFNQEKFDALLGVPTDVNAAIVPGLAKKNLEFLLTLAERLGRGELLGGSATRFKRDKNNGIKVDTEFGLGGKGDNQWPSIETEYIKNDKWYFDPVQNKSIPESLGIGVPEDVQIFLDLIKGQRAKGRLPDSVYRHFYRHLINGVLWEKKKGPLINIYNLITLNAVFEWFGPQMGITGYEMKKVLWENTEKTGSNFWKYLNG